MQSEGNFELPEEFQAKSGNSSEPSTSTTSSSLSENSNPSTSTSSDEEMKIFDNLRDDLSHLEDDDEYLTSTLEEEKELIKQYKNALQK
jgi:hypothetical protein